jgi:DNA-binding NtrC family response regulator
MLNTAIEERRITPVGSSDELRIDVRVLAATSRDLDALVASGQFRRDLLGRLSVVPLHVPPLREHPEDIPDLVRYFIGRLSSEMALPQVSVRPEAIARLQMYHWPYNVRELRNAVEQALIFHGQDGVLGEEAFGFLSTAACCSPPDGGVSGPSTQASFTRPWGPFSATAERPLDYHVQRDAVVLGFKREIMNRAFRMVGGVLERPHPSDIGKVAEVIGITPKGVRDILRDLENVEGP